MAVCCEERRDIHSVAKEEESFSLKVMNAFKSIFKKLCNFVVSGADLSSSFCKKRKRYCHTKGRFLQLMRHYCPQTCDYCKKGKNGTVSCITNVICNLMTSIGALSLHARTTILGSNRK